MCHFLSLHHFGMAYLAGSKVNIQHKVIHRELCKKLKFVHTNKWYMNNPESVQENEVPKLLWDFNIRTDYRTSARRPDLVIAHKIKNLSNSGRCCPGRLQSKIEQT